MLTILFLIIGYLVGSLSSAIIVCKTMGLPDPRTEGSGNAGATNVYRIGGKLPAILVLVGDILKGLIVVIIARAIGIQGFWLALVALAVVIGHMYPVFFKFQGGKGIATTFGCLLVLSFWATIILLLVWIAIVALTRYVSLASIVVAILAPIFMLFVNVSYFIPVAVITAFIIWRHMDNITRLKQGTENKIDFKEYQNRS